ncbi:MAG: biotin-independent malonate decarboxylase subunit gamma [Casimicrobiaceae bacterium]
MLRDVCAVRHDHAVSSFGAIIQSMGESGMRLLSPCERIAAIADPGGGASVDDALSAPRPSPHLARWGIAAQDDDGIALARATMFGAPVMIAAQDERFLGGSTGANHADALRGLFERARDERPAAVILLMASGGVRLYEANPAALALARALAALLDLRVAGVRVLAIGVGDVFGGASVLACAADRIALVAGTKLGLSGPRVIEMAHGRGELDASDATAVNALFGAEARAAAGEVDLVADDREVIRAWIGAGLRDERGFAERVHSSQARLSERWADRAKRADPGTPRDDAETPPPLANLYADAHSVDSGNALWRVNNRPVWITRPCSPRTFGPREAHALDAALLAQFADDGPRDGETVILVEDSPGHEATAAAEALCVSQFLAQHAAVLTLLRARGVRLVGLLAGTGHSAAFFSNALQAPRVYALQGARVVAMEPPAIARVTRLDPAKLDALIEDDPALGHPVRNFSAWGGIAQVLPDADRDRLLALASGSP